MKAFEYRAATPEGAFIDGRAWAASEVELDRELDARGLLLTAAKELPDGARAPRARIRHAELVHLAGQLATVTSAGVPLVDGLRGIGERLEAPAGRGLIREMVAGLEGGRSLSAVMGDHPESFPKVVRESVRAGEESGALDTVLRRVAKHLVWARGIRATTTQALLYPGILCGAVGVLLGILLYFVLPRIIGLFPGGEADLPAQTRFVLAVSTFLRAHGLGLLAGAGAAAVGVAWFARRPTGRHAISAALLRVPHLGDLLARLATSRFASTAGTLQASGCDMFTTLEVSAGTCGNAAMSAAFGRATERVRRGASLSQALRAEPLADPLLVQMVHVGERAGAVDACLDRLVEHYDEEVPRAVKRSLSVLEPALLIGAGVVVAFVLTSALLPIFDLYDRVG